MQVRRSMLTPKELSARTGIAVGTLSNWRVLRRVGGDIGPRFVRLSPGEKGLVRYMVVHIEEWEAKLASESGLKGPADAQNWARTTPSPAGRPTDPSPLEKSMLTPKELSKRTGVRLDYLSNWRVRQNYGEEIGPRFVKLGRLVRYLLVDVEGWERTRAERDIRRPASTTPLQP